jgi:hypothetical protein
MPYCHSSASRRSGGCLRLRKPSVRSWDTRRTPSSTEPRRAALLHRAGEGTAERRTASKLVPALRPPRAASRRCRWAGSTRAVVTLPPISGKTILFSNRRLLRCAGRTPPCAPRSPAAGTATCAKVLPHPRSRLQHFASASTASLQLQRPARGTALWGVDLLLSFREPTAAASTEPDRVELGTDFLSFSHSLLHGYYCSTICMPRFLLKSVE